MAPKTEPVPVKLGRVVTPVRHVYANSEVHLKMQDVSKTSYFLAKPNKS